jgi:DNA-directed RNA polymerase sigma subunit (sigma70/sigma32)
MDEGLGNRLMKMIKETAEVAGIKTEEYAKISRKRLDVLSLDRELGKEKGTLGDRVYELSQREGPVDVLQDVTVKACLTRIRELVEALGECEREIETIRQASQKRAGNVRERYAKEREGDASGADPAGSP